MKLTSGRKQPLSWRIERWRAQAVRPLGVGLLLTLVITMLSSCGYQQQYQNIRDAAAGVGNVISSTYQLPAFPTPQTGVTQYLPIPSTYATIPQTTPLPGDTGNVCANAEWWQKDIYQASGDMIKGFTRNIFLGGLVVFATSASTSDAAIEDGAVIWVSRILADMVWGVWPLALIWVVVKQPFTLLGGAGGSTPGQVLIRIFIAVALISTPSGPLPIAYLMGIPLLMTNAIFRFLLTAAVSGWTNLTAYAGIFSTDGSCNGLSLIPLALMAVGISIILVIISFLFILRSAMLYVYFAAAPAALAAGLFDETKHYQDEFVQNYIKLVFGLIPVGIIFLLMNAFVFAPSGDTMISANHMGLAIGCVFLMFFAIRSSLNGVPTMVWQRFRSHDNHNRTLVYGTAKAAGGLAILGAAGGVIAGASLVGGPAAGVGAAALSGRYIWRNRDMLCAKELTNGGTQCQQ